MLIVGGDTWWWTASAVITASTPPRAPSRWPCIDLVEFTASVRAWSPKAALIAAVSLASPSGVDVPCALTYWTSAGLSPPFSARRASRAAGRPCWAR
jgi:hypothetical protein